MTKTEYLIVLNNDLPAYREAASKLNLPISYGIPIDDKFTRLSIPGIYISGHDNRSLNFAYNDFGAMVDRIKAQTNSQKS